MTAFISVLKNDCFTVLGHITTWRTLCRYLNNILHDMHATVGFRGVSQSCGGPRPGAAVVDDPGIYLVRTL